jgi:vitamin B12 transporter
LVAKRKHNKDSFSVVGIDKKWFVDDEIDKDYNNAGAFIANSTTIKNTTLNLNLRTDQYSDFEDKTTYKIGLKQKIKLFEVIGNYGTSYKIPSIYQLFAPPTMWGKVGNKNLKPEDIKSYDISVAFKKNLFVTYFHNEIKDMIDFVNGYQNLNATSTIKGYEVKASKIFLPIYSSFSANYTYIDAKDKDNKTLARRPKTNINFIWNFFPIGKFSSKLRAEYVGERYDRKDEQGRQTGKYTLYFLSLNYKLTKNISSYLKIDNLTDKDYQIVDGYATANRSYYIGLKAKF